MLAAVQASSSSDDSSYHRRQGGLALSTYLRLELSSALREADNYVRAAQELTALVPALPRFGAVHKDTASEILVDAMSAVECCDSRSLCLSSLSRLVAACAKGSHLPQHRVRRLQSMHKRVAVAFARHKGPGDSTLPPGRFLELPQACLYQVLSLLDPIRLATSACVCREWRDALAGPLALPLWGQHLRALYAQVPAQYAGIEPAFAKNERELFYASAKVTPATVACFQHNRVAYFRFGGGAYLGWWRGTPAARRPGCRSLSVEEVISFLQRRQDVRANDLASDEVSDSDSSD